MNEFTAFIFIFLTVVLYRLTRKDKFILPKFATIKEVDIESQVQHEALEKMWVSHILHIQQGLIAGISTFHLIAWLATL